MLYISIPGQADPAAILPAAIAAVVPSGDQAEIILHGGRVIVSSDSWQMVMRGLAEVRSGAGE